MSVWFHNHVNKDLVIRHAWLDIGCYLADTNKGGRGRQFDGLKDVRSSVTFATEPYFGVSY